MPKLRNMKVYKECGGISVYIFNFLKFGDSFGSKWDPNPLCTWVVSKVSVLIFYLNVYWTHLKLQVISFKV